VNLVLQSPRSRSAGYDASGTGTFVNASLPFDPTADFHEYRFDFLAGRVLFYADGKVLATMTNDDDDNGSGAGAGAGGNAVPTTSGNLILSHWSNGNADWSGGPPARDAATVVRYVKAYYNASSPARREAAAARCVDPNASTAVCAVPEGDATYFFMYQDNMTAGQGGTGGSTDSGATTGLGRGTGSTVAFSVALSVFIWVCGLI
jgi:beta-glucanase (GH16 family)